MQRHGEAGIWRWKHLWGGLRRQYEDERISLTDSSFRKKYEVRMRLSEAGIALLVARFVCFFLYRPSDLVLHDRMHALAIHLVRF